jgi:uncharacterized Zn finger protein (UPF0148 family)
MRAPASSDQKLPERCPDCGAELQRFTSRLRCPVCDKDVALASNQKLKRYDVGCVNGEPALRERPNSGPWVYYKDAQAESERLQRALTEEQAAHRGTAALLRSAHETTVPRIDFRQSRCMDLCGELRRYFESGTLDTASDLYLLLQEVEAMQPEEPPAQCPFEGYAADGAYRCTLLTGHDFGHSAFGVPLKAVDELYTQEASK